MPGTEPLRVAIVGAESTGKSVLARALAQALAREFGLRCTVVDEYLREWCEHHRRTPSRQEQMGIALEHARRIDAAAAQADVDVVLCDTTPLMVSVYSDLLFDDRSLDPVARQSHAKSDFTLLTSLDLPWVADGLQRDGPHVRPPVDARVRERLLQWNAAWAVVMGTGQARTDHAMDALVPLLSPDQGRHSPAGLFSGLLAGASVGPPRPAPGPCARCDLPSVRPS